VLLKKGNVMYSKHVGLIVVLMLACGYTWGDAVSAQSTNTTASAEAEERFDDDVLTAGRTVHLQNAVAGDVAAAGAEVTIDGPVQGYVMSAGRSVTLDGRVGNDVWAAGETVTVDNSVGNNAMLAGRIVNLGPNAVIGHNARLAGNMVTAEGRIDRDLTIGAETAQIGADVGGAVRARADHVTVMPGAIIRGDLVVRASEPPEISPAAQVLGQVRFEDVNEGRWLAWPAQWLLVFLGLLILGVTATAFAPAWPARVAETLRSRTLASIFSGLLVLIVIPLAVGALAVTIIGIPLAIVMFAFYVAMLLLAAVFVSYTAGEWLTARLHLMRSSPWARLILGVLVISLLMSLPTVGFVVTAIVLTVGMGALVLERRSQRVLHPIA
jgi:hypothetical protein